MSDGTCLILLCVLCPQGVALAVLLVLAALAPSRPPVPETRRVRGGYHLLPP